MNKKEIKKQIRHQIEIEFDSNKGRFSETFIDAIIEIALNARPEIKKGESYRKGFLAGVAEENFAWRSHKRCSICGEKMKPKIGIDICDNCFKGKDSPSLTTANSQKNSICHAGQFHEIGCFCNKERGMLENNGT